MYSEMVPYIPFRVWLLWLSVMLVRYVSVPLGATVHRHWHHNIPLHAYTTIPSPRVLLMGIWDCFQFMAIKSNDHFGTYLLVNTNYLRILVSFSSLYDF